MNVILIILNNLFDENNKKFYIGDKFKIREINNTTNKVLNNINKYSILTKRKNKGIKRIIGRKSIESNIEIKYNIFSNFKRDKRTIKKVKSDINQ
jgi:hypothetical protein